MMMRERKLLPWLIQKDNDEKLWEYLNKTFTISLRKNLARRKLLLLNRNFFAVE